MYATKHDGRTRDRTRSRHARTVARERRTIRRMKYATTTIEHMEVTA